MRAEVLNQRLATWRRGGREKLRWATDLGRRHVGTVRPWLPIAVLVVGLVTNAVVLLVHSTGVWFWADDWDLLFLRGTIPQFDQGLFAPHNNHWLTAHALVYRALFDLFGMRSYTPYAVCEVAFHLLTVVLLRILVRRAGAGGWVATFTALTVAFFGLGANAEIYAASMNHVGALAFGLVALLPAASSSYGMRRQVATSVALVVALMFGLTGLAMLVLTGVFVGLRHGLASAARTLAPPLVVFGVWWLTYGRDSGVNSISPTYDLVDHLPRVPSYVWSGLTGTLGDGSGLVGAGPLLVALLALALVSPGPAPARLVHLAWAGAVADLFQLFVVSVARFDFGASQLGTSHYSYINIVLLAPAIALCASRVLGWAGVPRVALGLVAVVLFVAYALNGVSFVQKWQDDFRFLTASSDDLALGIKQAAENHEAVLSQTNPDSFNRLLIPRYVATPEIRQALGDARPSAQGRLRAESYFFTVADEKDHGLAHQPSRLTAFSGLPRVVNRSGCQTLSSTGGDVVLRLETDDLGNEIVVWSSSTEVTTRLERDGESSPDRTWKVHPGPVHVATSAPHAVLYATFDGTGSFTVCQA